MEAACNYTFTITLLYGLKYTPEALITFSVHRLHRPADGCQQSSSGQSAILSRLCLNSEHHKQKAPLSPCWWIFNVQAFIIIQRTSLEQHAEWGLCVLGCWVFICGLCQRGKKWKQHNIDVVYLCLKQPEDYDVTLYWCSFPLNFLLLIICLKTLIHHNCILRLIYI